MDKSFKRFLALFLLALAVSSGFLWGRSLGASPPPHHAVLNNLSRMFAANAAGGLGLDRSSAQDGESGMPPDRIFETVLEHVQTEYVDADTNNLKLSHGALTRMFSSLNDPKTNYLEAPLRRAKQKALQGRFYGIGAVLTVMKSKKADVEYRHLTVVDVMPNSPAEKAGLRTGDRLTEVDGHWIIAYSPRVEEQRLSKMKQERADAKAGDEATLNEEYKKEQDKVVEKFKRGVTFTKALPTLLTGENKKLWLTIERPGEAAPLSLELTTALTEVDPVEYQAVRDSIGYLRVRQFNTAATKEFQEALDSLGKDVKGLIVDLRANPGGVQADAGTGVDGYESALTLIARLTRGGKVASIEHRPNHREPLLIKSLKTARTLPLVVLVDGGTANLSELVAAALHDAGKAKIIGTRTFGDSTLQLFIALKNGGGVEMSTARLQTLNGSDLSKGITPDIQVSTTQGAGGDAVLQRALATLGAGA